MVFGLYSSSITPFLRTATHFAVRKARIACDRIYVGLHHTCSYVLICLMLTCRTFWIPHTHLRYQKDPFNERSLLDGKNIWINWCLAKTTKTDDELQFVFCTNFNEWVCLSMSLSTHAGHLRDTRSKPVMLTKCKYSAEPERVCCGSSIWQSCNDYSRHKEDKCYCLSWLKPFIFWCTWSIW